MRLSGKSLLSFVVLVLLVSVASGQTITEFSLPPETYPTDITTGPDGNLWFTSSGHPGYGAPYRVGRLSTSGELTVFPLPLTTFMFPYAITAGPDGNLWIAASDEFAESVILRISPGGNVTEIPVPNLSAAVLDITSGPDGNLWFTEFGTSQIGRMTPEGVITEFSTPSREGHPWGITAGPDGNLWFAQVGANQIGRITSAGVVTEFPVPTPSSRPRGITAGPDGNLWFTEANASQIGRITPDGEVTEFPVSTKASEIVAGPDGAVWFTQGARLGRITTSGDVTEFPLPDNAGTITAGPDRNIWLGGASKIWRFTLSPAHVTDIRILPVVGSTPGAGGTFFRTGVQLHNSTGQGMAGQIVFRRSGGSSNNGRLPYLLHPGQTLSISDLLPAMGLSGVGSADIETTFGSVPDLTVRVFNDGGHAGTTGFTEEPLHEDQALTAGRPGTLLLPADLSSFRFNVGMRSLREGATATLTLRNAAGTVFATVSRAFPETYHEQQSVSAFLGLSSPPPPGGSISIEVGSGAAFFYGASVDNVTGDPSFQLARSKR